MCTTVLPYLTLIHSWTMKSGRYMLSENVSFQLKDVVFVKWLLNDIGDEKAYYIFNIRFHLYTLSIYVTNKDVFYIKN